MATVERILQALRQAPAPLHTFDDAPYDEEGEDSDEERRAVEAALADPDPNIPHEEIERGLGLQR